MFFKDPSSSGSTDSLPVEQYMPTDTLVTVEIQDQELPLVFSELVKDGKVMQHPSITQHQPVPKMVYDSRLEMMLPSDGTHKYDPNGPITHSHPMAALAERAVLVEQAITAGPPQVQ